MINEVNPNFKHMKSIICCVFLLIFFSCSGPKKPEAVDFSVYFQPKKTYAISTIRGSETVITYSGEDFAMRKLKNMQVQNPTKSNIRTKADTELAVDENSVELTYKKTMSLDGKSQIPEGTVVQGILGVQGLPVFRTVISSDLSIDQRIKLLQTIQNTYDQIRFPAKQMKPGDTISVRQMQTMTIEGSEVETRIVTIAKLLSFDERTAQFSLTQTYEMTPQLLDNSFSGTGSGTGKMSFELANHFISAYSIQSQIDIKKKLDYFGFDLKTQSEFAQSIILK